MAKTPVRKVATKTSILPDPHRVFYMPAVLDTLKRGKVAEMKALIAGAREVQAKYGDIDGLVRHLEDAVARSK